MGRGYALVTFRLLVSLVGAAALVDDARPLYAEAGAGAQHAPAAPSLLARLDQFLVTRCLTPDAGRALQDLVATGALRPALDNDFTLTTVDLSANQIFVKIEDRAQRSYGITLALAGAKGGKPD